MAVVAFSAASGIWIWNSTAVGQLIGGTSIGADGTIYATSADGYLNAFLPDGSLRWRTLVGNFTNLVNNRNMPAISATGTVYVVTAQATLVAVNGTSGKIIWTYSFKTPSAYSSNAAIGADGTVYVCTGNTLYAITQDGHNVWSYESKLSTLMLSPALGPDGTLYVASSYTLYAFK